MNLRQITRHIRSLNNVLSNPLCLLACILFSITSICSPAQAQGKKHSPFKVLKPRPDFGGRLAFSVTRNDKQEIWIAELDTGAVIPFFRGKDNFSYPSWSPDGQWLAFVSDRTGKTEIFAAKWDKSKVIQVTDNGLRKGDPSWFPDSKNLVFYQSDGNDGKHTNLFAAPRRWKQKPKRLTEFPDGRNTTPRVSPDGKRIAFSTSRFWPGWDVCVWDLRRSTEKCPLNGDVSYCRPYWSKDTPSILYSTGGGKDVEIGMYNEPGEYFISLTQFPHREYDPVFGPNDKEIFFVSEGTQGKVFEVYWSREDKDKSSRLITSKLIQSNAPIRVVSWTKHSTLDLEVQMLKDKQASKAKPKVKK